MSYSSSQLPAGCTRPVSVYRCFGFLSLPLCKHDVNWEKLSCTKGTGRKLKGKVTLQGSAGGLQEKPSAAWRGEQKGRLAPPVHEVVPLLGLHLIMLLILVAKRRREQLAEESPTTVGTNGYLDL